jgi:hypothetical protein
MEARMATPITILGADRGYVKQGKDPETALRLSDRPNADWIGFLIESFGSDPVARRRQVSVSGDRLMIHAKVEEVAADLLPQVEAAVERANEGYAELMHERSEPMRPDAGDPDPSISEAFDAIDRALRVDTR